MLFASAPATEPFTLLVTLPTVLTVLATVLATSLRMRPSAVPDLNGTTYGQHTAKHACTHTG